MTQAATDDRDQAERLSADDQATLREEQLRDAALNSVRQAAQRETATRGRCSNCGAACLPQGIYCDEACRQDHEDRLRVLARQGRRG